MCKVRVYFGPCATHITQSKKEKLKTNAIFKKRKEGKRERKTEREKVRKKERKRDRKLTTVQALLSPSERQNPNWKTSISHSGALTGFNLLNMLLLSTGVKVSCIT